MAEPILCKICGLRRAKRLCPAVQGDICPLCCGTSREVSLSCPLDCAYLREAHKHDKPVALAPGDVSDMDIEIDEDFLREREEVLLFCIFSLVQGALRTANAVDSDVVDALAALIKTQRTADSGLLYETRPDNAVAAGIQRSFSDSLAEFQKTRQEREHLRPVSNTELLPMLVLLRRLAQQNNNGRPKGRLFIEMLSQMTPSVGVDERAPSIIL